MTHQDRSLDEPNLKGHFDLLERALQERPDTKQHLSTRISETTVQDFENTIDDLLRLELPVRYCEDRHQFICKLLHIRLLKLKARRLITMIAPALSQSLNEPTLQLRPQPLQHIVEPVALLLTWQPVDENHPVRTRRVVARIDRIDQRGDMISFRYLRNTEDFDAAADAGIEIFGIEIDGASEFQTNRFPAMNQEFLNEFDRIVVRNDK